MNLPLTHRCVRQATKRLPCTFYTSVHIIVPCTNAHAQSWPLVIGFLMEHFSPKSEKGLQSTLLLCDCELLVLFASYVPQDFGLWIELRHLI